MRKFLLLPLIAVALVLIPTNALATQPELPPEYDGQNKATICHWANGHVHAISISVNALDTHLVWHAEGGWNANPGHEGDTFLHFGKEEDEDDDTCIPDEPPIEPVCPEGTVAVPDSDPLVCERVITTTVTSIVEKEVIKEVPGPTQVITRTVEVPVAAPAAPTPAPSAAPATPPTGDLPRTGSNTLLPLLGAGLTSAGLVLRRLFR